MTRKDFLKKWLPVILTIILIITLALIFTSCSRSKTAPYGSLSNDKYYANISTNGWTYKLSEKDLYSEVKLDSKQILFDEIDRVIFKDEIKDFNDKLATSERYTKYLHDAINNICYSTTDEDTIAKMKPEQRKVYQLKYLDTLTKSGVSVDKTLSGGEYDIYGQASIISYYEIEMAKKIYTYNKLAEEFDKKYCMSNGKFGSEYCGSDVNIDDIELDDIKDTDNHFPKDFYTEYTSSYKNQGDLGAIVVRFSTTAEYNKTIQALRLATYGSKWYQVAACTDSKCQSDPDFADKWYADKASELKSIDRTGKDLKDNEVLAYYLLMYNYMYDYRTNIVFDILDAEGFDITGLTIDKVFELINTGDAKGTSIINKLATSQAVLEAAPADGGVADGYSYEKLASFDTNNYLTYEYKELSSATTIRTYLFTTLKALPTNDDDYSSLDSRYSVSYRSQDKGYFIGYKLTQSSDKEYNDELRAIIREDLIDAQLSSEAITTKYNERMDEVFKNKGIKVYDPELETLYGITYANYKKTNDKSSTAVAVVNGTEILVDNFAKSVLNQYGVNTTVDLVLSEYLKHDERYTKQINRDDLVAEYNNYMDYFSNGSYATYGYPASIGKDNFLKLFFGANNMDEAIDRILLPQKLKTLYFADYDSQKYGDSSIYELFAKYTEKNYDEYFNLTYQNLLINIDFNEDGTVDNPRDLSSAELTAYQQLAKELAQKIGTRIDNAYGVTKAEAVSNIVTEYQSFSRFTTQAFRDYAAANEKTSTDWSKFKKAGIQLTLESSANLTNSKASGYAEEFVNRLVEVYADEPGSSSHWGEDDALVTFLDTNATETDFGWHLILFTAGSKPTSAKFTESDDTTGIYKNLKYTSKFYDTVIVENAYNDSNCPNANQIEIYIRDLNTGKKVNVNLPTTSFPVSTTVSTFFGDIYTRYTSSSYTSVLAIKYLKDHNANLFQGEFSKDRFNQLLDITERTIDGYVDYETETGVYTGWWTDFDYRLK